MRPSRCRFTQQVSQMPPASRQTARWCRPRPADNARLRPGNPSGPGAAESHFEDPTEHPLQRRRRHPVQPPTQTAVRRNLVPMHQIMLQHPVRRRPEHRDQPQSPPRKLSHSKSPTPCYDNGIRLVNFAIRLRIRSWALVIR